MDRGHENVVFGLETLQVVLDALPEFVYLQAPDYSIRFANKSFIKLFGEPGSLPCYQVLHGRQAPCESCPTFQVFKTLEPRHWEWARNPGEIYLVHDIPVTDTCGSPLVLEIGFDITAQKLVEEALRQSEAQLAEAQRISKTGSWVNDLTTRKIRWSDELYRIFEMERSEFGVDYATFLSRVHPDDIRAVLEINEKAIASGNSFDFEYRIVTPRGGLKTIREIGYTTHDASGKVVRLLGTAQDITARKQVEKSLFESEQLLRNISNNINGLIYRVILRDDGSRQFIYLSDRVKDMYGITPEQGMADARLIYDTVHEEDRDRVRQAEEFCHKTMSLFKIDARIINHKGQMRWSSFMSRPKKLPDGSTCWDGIELDITERKGFEENLLRLTAIIESTTDLVAIARSDMTVEYMNRAGRDMLGWQGDIESKKIGDAHPAWAYEIVERQGIPAARLNGTWTGETALQAPDGRELPVSQTIIAHRTLNDRISHTSTIMRDITELKGKEERIRAALGEKEVLLREVHHRVKNNMQVISSLIDLQSDTINSPELSPLFKDLQDRVRSMAMVHEKLYQSASLAGLDFAEYASSLLAAIWKNSLSDCSSIRLTENLNPVSMTVERAIPLGLILNELATNALKHGFTGRREGEVTVSLHAGDDGMICLQVADNGRGFPEGFEWKQAPTLGLRLVYLLAEQLRGTAETVLPPSGGAQFAIRFPS